MSYFEFRIFFIGLIVGVAALPLAFVLFVLAHRLWDRWAMRFSSWAYPCRVCGHTTHGGSSPPADPATGVRPYEDVTGSCCTVGCSCTAMTPALRFYPNRPPTSIPGHAERLASFRAENARDGGRP